MTMADVSALATYNAEVARGIVHTEDYSRRMAALQAEYNEGMRLNRNPNVWPPFFVEHDHG